MRRGSSDRNRRDRYVRLGIHMRLEHLPVIHPVKLIAAKYQNVLAVLIIEIDQVLANRIGRPLKPCPIGIHRLLRREQLDKTTRKIIKTVRLTNVLMQRNTQELRYNINFIDIAVQAVADWNVDESVLGRQRNSRFRSDFRQRVKTGPSTTP
jgi:hypothetical protein